MRFPGVHQLHLKRCACAFQESIRRKNGPSVVALAVEIDNSNDRVTAIVLLVREIDGPCSEQLFVLSLSGCTNESLLVAGRCDAVEPARRSAKRLPPSAASSDCCSTLMSVLRRSSLALASAALVHRSWVHCCRL